MLFWVAMMLLMARGTAAAENTVEKQKRLNVLFIAIDDLNNHLEV